MAQPAITSFFNSRKRAATEDVFNAKNKQLHLERDVSKQQEKQLLTPSSGDTLKNVKLLSSKKESQFFEDRRPKRKVVAKLAFDNVETTTNNVPKQIPFMLVGTLSPSKRILQEDVPPLPFASKKAAANIVPESNTNKSRKDLNLNDIKQKLLNNPRLSELKQRAAKLSEGIANIEAKKLKGFKSIDLEIPTSPSKRSNVSSPHNDAMFRSPTKDVALFKSPTKVDTKQQCTLMSPRKVVVSPVKSPTKVPAYIRHASLASTSTALPIPHHYRLLMELFRGMETVTSLFYNRKEQITFKKLKPSIQEMVKRNFMEKHLAQIKFLAPEMYNYQLHKIKSFSLSDKNDIYDIMITPQLADEVTIMTPKVLLERRHKFHEKILSHLKELHAKFLLNLDPPMNIPNEKITRWHPEFELEKIPEVECADIPLPPNKEKISSAEDVLSRARELFKCNTRMERALEKLAVAKARGFTDKEKEAMNIQTTNGTCTQTEKPSTSNVTILNPALRNLPPALLAKVKAKQAAKALEAMTRSADHDKKAVVYSRLPDLARTLRNIFVTERKNVLSLKVILSKLDNSFKAKVSAGDLEDDLKLLSEHFPKWLIHQEVRNTVYLKLDRNYDMEKIKTKLEQLAKQYN